MEERITLWGLTSLGSIISYLTGSFTPLIYIMIAFAILDLITEVGVIIKKGESVKGSGFKWRFLRKFYYFALVAVAFGFDLMIYLSTENIYSDFQWNHYFGVLAIMYLTVTEGLSILENLEEFDIKFPFLGEGLKAFKSKIEKKNDKN